MRMRYVAKYAYSNCYYYLICQETGWRWVVLGGTKRHSLYEGASHNTNTAQYKYITIYITDTANKAEKEQITRQKQRTNCCPLNATPTHVSLLTPLNLSG